MAEPVGGEYRVRRLEEQVRLMGETIDYLSRVTRGLQYEPHTRDLRIGELEKENELLPRRREEQAPPPPPPPFVKPGKPPGRRKKPGRKAGHEAALRPPPGHVDRTVDVPLRRGP